MTARPMSRQTSAAYFEATLVRVIGTTHNDRGGQPFCAGLLMDPTTEQIIFAAPILRYLVGQPRAKLQQTFRRLGWRATIVQRNPGSV